MKRTSLDTILIVKHLIQLLQQRLTYVVLKLNLVPSESMDVHHEVIVQVQKMPMYPVFSLGPNKPVKSNHYFIEHSFLSFQVKKLGW